MNLEITAASQAPKKELDIESLKSKIEELKQLLSEDDSQATKLYEEILEDIKGTAFEEKYKGMGKFIRMYDFEAALEVFDEATSFS